MKGKSGMNPVKARDADIMASRRNAMKNMVHLVLTLSLAVFLAQLRRGPGTDSDSIHNRA